MKLSVRDLEVRGKRVLVRVDFNVPVEERDGKIVITDDTRIRESIADDQLAAGARRENDFDVALRSAQRQAGRPVLAAPVADHLHTLINQPVDFQSRYHRQGARGDCGAHEGRRRGLASESSVSTGGRGERSGICESAGEAWRSLHERRVWCGASCPRLHCRDHEVYFEGGDGFPDGKGASNICTRNSIGRANRSSSSWVVRKCRIKLAC